MLQLPEGMQRPGVARGLSAIGSNWFLLKLLVRKDLRVRYQGSVLGLAWSYVKPAAQFAVFFFVMGHFLELARALPPFAIFLFSGIVAVNLFTEVLGNSTRSIVQNSNLVKKIYMPRVLFPVSSVIVALVHFVPQVLILTTGALLVGWRPDFWAVAAFLLGLAIVIALALGVGLIFSALNVAFRDVENFVDLIAMVAIWFSPVLYSSAYVRNAFSEGHWLVTVYMLNPLTIAVELFHRAFWWPAADVTERASEIVDSVMMRGAVSLVAMLVLVAVGNAVFVRMSRRFAQEL